jgi:methyl-accepting chemotaxis protein
MKDSLTMSQWVRRLTLLTLFASFVGGLACVLFGVVILRPVEGSGKQLTIVVGAVFAVIAFFRIRADMAMTERVRGLAKGTLPAEEKHLTAALGELLVFPDSTFANTVWAFVWGGFISCFVYSFWADAPWTLGIQVFLLGLTIGPVAALFAHVLLVSVMRHLVRELVGLGLETGQIIAQSTHRRHSVRDRLIIFSAIGTMTPSLLIAQLYLSRTDLAVGSLAQTSDVQAALQLGMFGIFLSALFIGWIVLIAYLGVSTLVSPMQQVAQQAEQIAEGNLRPQSLILAEDEIWATSTAFIRMRTQLLSAVEELKHAGDSIGGATDSLVKTSQDHGAGTRDQVHSLNQTSVTTEELARSAQEIANRATSVADIARKTLSVALAGHATADAFFGSMNQMKSDNHAIADAVVKLNKRVQQIGKIVEFINEIADKSDLLALNAELEGTKAGDVGRGFSLVAAEMRRLAETVMSSTREIAGLINDIRDAANAAVMATEAGVKATEAGSAISVEVSKSLKTIVDVARQTSDAVQTISLATQQQQTGTNQLAEAMANVLEVTQQGALATEQMSGANTDLATLAKELQQVVDRFQTQ